MLTAAAIRLSKLWPFMLKSTHRAEIARYDLMLDDLILRTYRLSKKLDAAKDRVNTYHIRLNQIEREIKNAQG